MSTQIHVRTSVSLRDAVAALAAKRGVDVSRMIRRMLWAWVRGEIDPTLLPDPPRASPSEG